MSTDNTPQTGLDGAVPWARQPSFTVERKTERSRRIVTTLPDWDPLPPGEILVRRPDHYG